MNSSKREQHYIENDIPELYSGILTGWIYWIVDYSPNTEWVVYYNNHFETVAYDVIHKRNIWKSPQDTYGDHAWSSDGNEVAVATFGENGNLLIINRNGDIKPILENDKKNIPSSPSWSPDGRYLAFLNDHTYLLYDKQTNLVIDYCIRGDWNPYRFPLWLSNSQQFIVAGVGSPNQSTFGSILIDIQNNRAYTISTNDEYYPMALMNSLP